MPRQVLTSYEIAEILGMAMSTLWRKIRDGTFPIDPLPRRSKGDSLTWSIASVEQYLGHDIDLDSLEFSRLPRIPEHKYEDPEEPK